MTAAAAPACDVCRARGTCFFAELQGADRDAFRSARVSNVYRKRQVVFYEGHQPHGVFLVCSGRVKVFKADGKGHQLTTRVAGQGELLGYRALLAGEPYAATAEALEDTCLTFVDGARFRALLAAHRPLADKMITRLSREVRIAEDTARDMAMKPSRERLAALIRMLDASGRRDGREGTAIVLPYSRQDLAELAGLAQETVIRLLTEMEEQKIIATRGRELTVLDPGRLDRAAGAPT